MLKIRKKEKWGKPKLIALVRGRLEEGVLAACKGLYWMSGDDRAYNNQCLYTADPSGPQSCPYLDQCRPCLGICSDLYNS